MMETIAMEVFLCGLFVLALLGSLGALGCFLQMCVYQNADWEHDREVGWASAHLCLQRQIYQDYQHLSVIFSEFNRDKLGGLHCPIHGREAYKDGGQAYFKTLRKPHLRIKEPRSLG